MEVDLSRLSAGVSTIALDQSAQDQLASVAVSGRSAA